MKDERDFMTKADFLSKEDLKYELKEFREFAIKKNMLELAIAFILGGAFQKVVSGLSENLMMPLINGCLSTTGTAWREATWAIGGISIEIGQLGGAILDFLITALILYILYMKIFKRLMPENKKPDPRIPVPILMGSK